MSRFTETLRTQRLDGYRDDHQSRINQTLHLVSAVIFLVCYAPALASRPGAGRVRRKTTHVLSSKFKFR